MRKRAKRDLITLGGVILIISAIVGANIYIRLEGIKERYENLRMAFEQKQEAEGHTLIHWGQIRKIKGRRIPTFTQELIELDSHPVNLCGFMAPINQFKSVTEYMLLPTPMTCYFCDSPPMRDIVHVTLMKPGDLVNEPIINGGQFKVHQEKRPKFFTEIRCAKWNEAIDAGEIESMFTEKEISDKHKKHLIAGFDKYFQEQEEELLQGGFEPPTFDESDLGH